jgi:hypothetical protein
MAVNLWEDIHNNMHSHNTVINPTMANNPRIIIKVAISSSNNIINPKCNKENLKLIAKMAMQWFG